MNMHRGRGHYGRCVNVTMWGERGGRAVARRVARGGGSTCAQHHHARHTEAAFDHTPAMKDRKTGTQAHYQAGKDD